MANKVEPEVIKDTISKADYEELKKQNEQLQTALQHYVDELRFTLGIAIQARPEVEQLQIMVNELFRKEQ